MKYFFRIKGYKYDINGNWLNKVYGYKTFTDEAAYIPLGKEEMKRLFHGRWSGKDLSVTTQDSKNDVLTIIKITFQDEDKAGYVIE